MDDILVLCALIAAVPAMMLFTYMFDDKADHGKNGFLKYILKQLFDSCTKPVDKPTESTPEQPAPAEEEKKEN